MYWQFPHAEQPQISRGLLLFLRLYGHPDGGGLQHLLTVSFQPASHWIGLSGVMRGWGGKLDSDNSSCKQQAVRQMFQILLSAAERENRLRTRLAYFFVKSRHQLHCGMGMGQTSFEKSSPQTMRLKLFQNFLSFNASCSKGRVIPYLKAWHSNAPH